MQCYRVVVSKSLKGLMREVNLLLNEYWTPSGGIAVNGPKPFQVFYQAMVIEYCMLHPPEDD